MKADCRTFRVDTAVSCELDNVAEQLGMTVSDVIRRAVSGYIRVLKKRGVYTPQMGEKEVILLRN